MAQQVKAILITKPDNLNFLPRPHPHGGRKESTPGKLVFTCAWGQVFVYICNAQVNKSM